MSYSMRSNAMKSLSSIMTAPTNPSIRSSAIQSSRRGVAKLRSSYSTASSGSRRFAPIKKDTVWARYKKKNEIEAKEREMRKSHSLVGSPIQDRVSVKSLTRSNLSEARQNRVMLAPNATKIHMNVHTNAPTTIPDLKSADHIYQDEMKAESVK